MSFRRWMRGVASWLNAEDGTTDETPGDKRLDAAMKSGFLPLLITISMYLTLTKNFAPLGVGFDFDTHRDLLFILGAFFIWYVLLPGLPPLQSLRLRCLATMLMTIACPIVVFLVGKAYLLQIEVGYVQSLRILWYVLGFNIAVVGIVFTLGFFRTVYTLFRELRVLQQAQAIEREAAS